MSEGNAAVEVNARDRALDQAAAKDRVVAGLDETVRKKFWGKVSQESPGDCWIWQGFTNQAGYGQFTIGKLRVQAHRAAYVLTHGSIPERKVLDHICRQRGCVNPAHLRPVTMSENTLYNSDAVTAINLQKTHCKNGHPLSGANLWLKPRPGRTERACRKCHNVERIAGEKRRRQRISATLTQQGRDANGKFMPKQPLRAALQSQDIPS